MNQEVTVYLTDSYCKTLTAKVIKVTKKGNLYEIILDKTIFYPEGGGQASDHGLIISKNGKCVVKDVRISKDTIIHFGSVTGNINDGDEVTCEVDWKRRYQNMKRHSAGHLLHEAVMSIFPSLIPIKGNHTLNDSYIEYKGYIDDGNIQIIEERVNQLIHENLKLSTEFVSLDELKKRSTHAPSNLPTNKPLRILEIEGYKPMPDGGTQVNTSSEIGKIKIISIANSENSAKIYYSIAENEKADTVNTSITPEKLLSEIKTIKDNFDKQIKQTKNVDQVEKVRLEFLLAKNSHVISITKQLGNIDKTSRPKIGNEINTLRDYIHETITNKVMVINTQGGNNDWIDVTAPGNQPPSGHLHIVSQAIEEITRIFEQIGFTRVRYPEVEWEWYAFEGLNMPKNHPARDDFETFFIDAPSSDKYGKIVLSPHTSSGQVREMERLNSKPPIRMINIAKCYRPNWDVSHVPMFHQFEGLVVDEGINITNLKGTMDYFAKQFFGPDRKTRLRPFHFQFTEPSFEVDINCSVCLGTAKLPDGSKCRLCKEGWLELGGSGMVHPNVLKAGKIDPIKYTGFAFGWGIERTYMMKSGTKLDDIRDLYNNDLRFLEQF